MTTLIKGNNEYRIYPGESYQCEGVGMSWRNLLTAIIIVFTTFYVIHILSRRNDAEDKKKAAGPYKRAMEGFDPKEYHTRRAFAYEAGQSYEKALKEYQEIVKIHPEDSVTRSHLGAMYYKVGMLDQAIAELEEILKRNPGNWGQREALANLYCEQGRYAQAIEEYEESLRINPDNALGHRLLGTAYYEVGSYFFSIAEYKKSIEIDPAAGEAYFGLGICYIARGEMKAALEQKRILEKINEELAAGLSEKIEKARGPE